MAVVVLPSRAPASDAMHLVRLHQDWVNRHVARMRAKWVAINSRPPLDTGRRDFRYEGVLHRLVVTTSITRARSSVELVAGESILVVRAARERRSTAEVIGAWMRSRARAEIQERVSARSLEMGLIPGQVTIRDQRSRWGSASAKGTLSFNWRLLMCPPSVLDYVVVHEIAHLKVRGHPRTFWRLVERHFAGALAARRWLREHHDEIRHALD